MSEQSETTGRVVLLMLGSAAAAALVATAPLHVVSAELLPVFRWLVSGFISAYALSGNRDESLFLCLFGYVVVLAHAVVALLVTADYLRWLWRCSRSRRGVV